MAKKKEKELMVTEEAGVPDYIKNDGPARGSEEVGQEDLTIPRLELVQSLSPCRDKDDAAYIEGAEEGMLYNNVSREIYGESVNVVPVIFKKEWLVWKDRKQGGGFRGAYPSLNEANDAIVGLVNAGDDPDGSLEAVDTAQHLCLLLKEDGKVEEIAVSMSKSKMKVSRQWNSIIRLNGGDRFSRVYELRGVGDKNNKGEKFKNFSVRALGYPSQEVYNFAEEIYKDLSSGNREMKVNADQDQQETDPSAETNF